MAASDHVAAAANADFIARISMFVMQAAIAVSNEDPSTTNHANRMVFARSVLRSSVSSQTIATAVVASSSAVQTAIDSVPSAMGANATDYDVQNGVNSLINSFANAYANMM